MSIHDAAQTGFTAEAGTYERGRPEYPEGVLHWLRDTLRIGAGGTVVDLGAGTGKFTKLLARTGADLIAIEPVEAMRDRLAQTVPDARVIAGTAASMPIGEASVDAVVCAQAFHWFADGQSLREMRRVLRPGGRLGLIWNVRDESVDWVAAITAIITPYEGDAPRFHTGKWKRPFDDQSLFTAPQRTSFAHQHVGSFQQVVIDRFLSVSFIAALPATRKREVETALRALPEKFPVLRETRVAFPYLTEAWASERIG